MANIEWKQVQNVPGNPVDGFRTFMEGMRGAEAAARGIRQNEIQNTDMSLKILDSISKDQQAAQASMIKQAQIAAKPQPFNRQILGTAARDHYYSGGSMDDFQFAGFDPTDKEQFNHVSGIFKDNEAKFEQAIESASEELKNERLSAFEDLRRRFPEGTPEYEDRFTRLTQEFDEREGNIRSTLFSQRQREYRNNREALGLNPNIPGVSQDALFSGSSASQIEGKATGVTPKQVSQGITGNPSFAQSRIAERNAEENNQAGIRDESIVAIEAALAAGEIDEEEAAVEIGIANEQYNAMMQDYDDKWNQSVMTGADGSVYGTDFQYNEDGTITVSGQTLSPEVSSAVEEAAEISGIPVDMQLGMYRAESGYNPSAVSKTGAGGLGQLTGDAIKDVIQNYPEELEAAGIPLSADMDRSDPRTNAIVSSLYMKLQHEKYMGGKGSIEDRYIAYNIGAKNSFVTNERFANADPDTPIDQIGFPVSSDAVQKNIEVYRKPNGQWRTKNEVYSEIRRRMGITKASPEDGNPTKSIEERIATENARTPSELPLVEQEKSPVDTKISKNYQELVNIDPRTDPQAFANLAGYIADSIIPDPGVVKGESVSNLDVTFYEEALGKAGVPADSKTVARIREAFIKDPELRRLSSTEVSMLISWSEKGMWGSKLDMPGLRTNIKKIRKNQEDNRREYRQFVGDSKKLKEVSDDIKARVEAFNKKAASSQERLLGYGIELSSTNDPKEQAILIQARNAINEEAKKDIALHEASLQRLTTDALELAERIETKKQHLEKVFNKGVSKQARVDLENAAKGRDDDIYRDPLTGNIKSKPVPISWKWEKNSQVWDR